jgi:hypothetical protein
MLLIVLILGLNSCIHTNDNLNAKGIYCYIGKVKISKFPNLGGYNIYVSLKVINKTKDTIFTPSYDLPSYTSSSKSYFIGQIDSERIDMERITGKSKIPPNDSIRILLFYRLYKPRVTDSLFVTKIKNMKIEYKYTNKTNASLNYMRVAKIQRTKYTRLVILNNYTYVEHAFLFGNEEFK